METHTNRRLGRAAIGLAGLLLILATVACDADANGATPTSTASPEPTSTPQPPATASPTRTPRDAAGPPPTPTAPVAEEVSGVFRFSFEESSFTPRARCPGEGEAYWVTWDEFDLGAALAAATGTAPFVGGATTTYRVSVEGLLSEPGRYGHLGQYTRELTVTDLVAADVAEDCDDLGSVPGGRPVDTDAVAAYEAARALWDAAAVESYSFTLNRNCFCPPEFRGPFEITVEDGVATETLFEGQAAEAGVGTTVDEVFEEIERALNRGVLVELSYDPTDGYPRTVRLDLSAIAADGGLSLDIGDLVASD